MMKKTFKRALSLVLAVLILSSMACIVASANNGEKTNPLITDVVTNLEGTNTYYFYMPDEWRNEYNDHSTVKEEAAAGIYWWDGDLNCNDYPNSVSDKGWPGYRVTETVAPNVFVAHVPKNVPTIVWCNTVDGGEDNTAPEYISAYQTEDIKSEFYSANDPKDTYKVFPDGMPSFDGMIFVLNPEDTTVSPLSGKTSFKGSWLYYYGNGEYGTKPTKEEAEAAKAVYSNGEFPKLGFNIDKEETYVAVGDTDVIIPTEIDCTVENDNPAVASFTQDPKTGKVTVKGLKDGVATLSFTHTVPAVIERDEEGNPVLDENGAEIIVTPAEVSTRTCKVNVFTPPTEISVKAKAKTIYVKKSTTVSAKVEYGKGKTTFKSSNTKVATVNSKGKVTAKKAGTVKITATNNGESATVTIKVKNPTVKAPKSIKVKKTGKITVKNAVGKTKFKALNKYAKVSKTGKVTGKKKGTARIQVIASGVKFTVKIKIKK